MCKKMEMRTTEFEIGGGFLRTYWHNILIFSLIFNIYLTLLLDKMADVPMNIDEENAAAVAPQLGPHYMVRNQNAKLTPAQLVLRYADSRRSVKL
jgi:hypothetical protein